MSKLPNPSITVFFAQLDELKLPDSHHRTTKKQKKQIIKDLEQILTNGHNDLVHSKRKWPQLFQDRFEQTQQILLPGVLDHYNNLCKLFLKNKKLFDRASPSPALQAAQSIIDFASTHREDPDSILIGKRPRKRIVETVLSNRVKRSRADKCSKEEIIELIVAWSKLEDKNLVKEVRTFSTDTKTSEQQFVKGEILLIDLRYTTPQEHPELPAHLFGLVFYARYCHTIHSRHYVHLNPQEEPAYYIPEEVPIYLLSYELKQNLGSSRYVEHMLYNPIERVLRQLEIVIKKTIIDHLNTMENGIDVIRVLDLANCNQASITECARLIRVRNCLQELLANIPQNLVEISIKKGEGIKKEFLAEFDRPFSSIYIFPPLRESSLFQLKSFDIKKNLIQRLQRFLDVCDSGLEQIALEKRDILNGRTKENLVSWWLDLIHDSVHSFLTKLGYDHLAVPPNYTEIPPASFDSVYNNSRIIKEIIDHRDIHSVRELMKELSDLIYAKINDFVMKSKAVLRDQFQDDDEDFCMENVLRGMDRTRHDMEPATTRCYSNLIKDLKYLDQMMYLEENPHDKSIQEVVPISSLIFGRFVRLDKEIKTVLELWEVQIPPEHNIASSSWRDGSKKLSLQLF